MTQDEIIEMYMQVSKELCNDTEWCWAGVGEPLQMFANLVAAKALREHAMREVQRLGQEIEQEPFVGITAIRTWFKDGRVVTQTLCNSWVDTTPPQRSESSGKPSAWVGLTDEEYTHITDTVFHTGQGLVAYYKAIEARLKEKNNA